MTHYRFEARRKKKSTNRVLNENPVIQIKDSIRAASQNNSFGATRMRVVAKQLPTPQAIRGRLTVSLALATSQFNTFGLCVTNAQPAVTIKLTAIPQPKKIGLITKLQTIMPVTVKEDLASKENHATMLEKTMTVIPQNRGFESE